MISLATLTDAYASVPQLQFVFFGSSGCGMSKSKELHALLRPAMASIESAARSRGWSFESIAVTVDESKEHGDAFLKSYFSDFDTRVCDGSGFSTPLFQDLIMKRPAVLEGVSAQVEGVPYLVILKVSDGKVVLGRFLSGSINYILEDVASPDLQKRTKLLNCLLDQTDCRVAASPAR